MVDSEIRAELKGVGLYDWEVTTPDPSRIQVNGRLYHVYRITETTIYAFRLTDKGWNDKNKEYQFTRADEITVMVSRWDSWLERFV